MPKGLEGVVAANSSICYIDGDAGVLAYRGIDIHELAEKSTFEETCYLLWFGRLPNRDELSDLTRRLAVERKMDPAIYDMMRQIPRTATPMEVLRTAVSALSFYDIDAKAVDHDSNVRKAISLTSQIPMIVAGFDRIRKGKSVTPPNPSLSHAANFLLMLNGEKPTATAEKALDVALILHADHEFNASTFAARVTAATLSDMHSAITSATGALKGPLHGGANEEVLTMLEQIKADGSGPQKFVDLAKKKDSGFRLMGFGHRVYKNYDPRAKIIKEAAYQVFEVTGKSPLIDVALELEKIALDDEYFVKRRLYPNVDFYSGIIYDAMGFPVEMFPVLFAIPRTSGWMAQWAEMVLDEEQRIARPKQVYIGHGERAYLPLDARRDAGPGETEVRGPL